MSGSQPESPQLETRSTEGASPAAEHAVDRGVRAPATLALGIRFFPAPAGQPRARRGTDAVLLVAALLGPVLAIAAYPPSTLEQSLETFLAGLPGFLDPVWGFLSDLLWLWALVLAAIALVRLRLVVVAQALAALVLGALLALWASRVAVGSWPALGDAIFGTSRAPRFPATGVAEATALIVTVSPHLARPVRAFGRFARSFGAHVDLAELLVINISVSLLASFIPVPAGIGVAEFGLTIGLTSAGMIPEAAIAAVLLYRISTYYLPPAWGFPAMLWLQRNRYL